MTCDCTRFRCVLQSEETLLAPEVSEMTSSGVETTDFIDSRQGVSVGSSSTPLDYEVADAQTSATLARYLQRPVRISTFSWAQASALGATLVTLNPWHLFLDNASIKAKIQNFAFIRGNLKIKIVTNGSPFLYGTARAVYRPLPNFKTTTIAGPAAEQLIPLSQLPGSLIYPSHSEGVEMTLPFLWPRSFLRLNKAQDFIDMGQLVMVVYSPLLSANGTTSSVTVQTYAWMEDVVLAGPTLAPVLQGDEYGVGPVSAPASAVAAVAKKLVDVPVIGKFAKATEIGASAVSTVAKLFGFTNVPVIAEAQPMRNAPFPSLASAEIGYPSEKLALDPKNELSIDPAIAGCSSDDELAISNFATRESFLARTTWSTATAVDTPLFTSLVQPQLGNKTFVPGGARFQFTPMGLPAVMFRNWRGDITFRFKFIASPFHKGRVRISYDPYSDLVQTTGDTGPYTFNKIVDLGAETDVEVTIPYQQALPWCYNRTEPNNGDWSTSTTPSVAHSDTFSNGIISLKVLTALTAPVSTSSIDVLVYVKGAPNLQFSNPSSSDYSLTPFALQSLEYDEESTENMTMGVTSEEHVTNRALVNFGENVLSLRSLMRRQNLLDILPIGTATANTSGVYQITQTRFPPHYGYDPSGLNTAKGVITVGSNYNFNFVKTTPWHLIANCFLAQRGSMIWTFNPHKGWATTSSRITRVNGLFSGYAANYKSTINTNINVVACGLWRNPEGTGAGGSVTHTQTTNGHSVLAPSYSPFKFQSTDPINSTSPGGTSSSMYDGTIYDTLSIEYPYDTRSGNLVLDNEQVERYFGIGTDYTLHFFLNCPTLYQLPPFLVVPN